jgi:TRAP-type C4-dicarboxylate transport system permease small subunit
MRKIVDRLLGNVLAFLMALMTIDVLWQVFSRYILRSPSSFTDELARFLLIWIGILGAAYVAGRGKHLAIDLLPGTLSPKGRRRLIVFISLVIFVFAAVVMVIGGIRLVYITLYLEQRSSALRVPLGYVYLVLPISGLLVMYYKSLIIFQSLKNA